MTSVKVLSSRSPLPETRSSFQPSGLKTKEAGARRGSRAARARATVRRRLLRSRRRWRCDSFSPSARRTLLPLSNEEKRTSHHPYFGARAGIDLETRPEKAGDLSCFHFPVRSWIGRRQHENPDWQISDRGKDRRRNAVRNGVQETPARQSHEEAFARRRSDHDAHPLAQ